MCSATMWRNTTPEEHEGQQIMQAEEAVERRVIDAESAPQPGDDGFTDERNGGEQVGDDGRTPVGHLPPGQHVAHESGRHHQQQENHADDPQQLARILVRTVVEPAKDVDIDHDEEHRGAVLVDVAQHPPVVHVAHDPLHAVEGELGVRGVVHREKDAGRDHDREIDHGQRAEIPEIIEVPGSRETPYSFCIMVKIGIRVSIQFTTGFLKSLLYRPAMG